MTKQERSVADFYIDSIMLAAWERVIRDLEKSTIPTFHACSMGGFPGGNISLLWLKDLLKAAKAGDQAALQDLRARYEAQTPREQSEFPYVVVAI